MQFEGTYLFSEFTETALGAEHMHKRNADIKPFPPYYFSLLLMKQEGNL